MLLLLITFEFDPELLLLFAVFGDFDTGKRDDLGLAALLLGVVEFLGGHIEGKVS